MQKSKSTVVSDTQAPTVSIAAPTGGKVSGVVPVDVAASDNVAVTRVDLLVDGKVLLSDSTAPYSFSWDTSRLSDGGKQLHARSYDAAGNAGTSNAVSVTVANDTVAPTVLITSPANGSTVGGDVTVAVSANDDVKVARLSLTIDGKEVAVALNSGTLSYSWSPTSTSTKLKRGGGGKGKKGSTTTTSSSTTIVAKAEDPAGNVATASVTVKY